MKTAVKEMRIMKLVGVLIAFATLLLSAGANAALIEFTTSFQLNNTDNAYYSYTSSGSNIENADVQLSRFDTSLGSLTDVSISLASSFDHNSYGYTYDSSYYSTGSQQYQCGYNSNGSPRYCYRTQYGNSTNISGNANVNLEIALTDPLGVSALATSDWNNIYCSNSYSGSSYGHSISCSSHEEDDGILFNGSFDLSSTTVSDFIGVDPIDLYLTNSADYYAYCNHGSGGNNCYANNTVYWSGDITVSYTYDEIVVSEPGTLGLLGAGWLGLILARRKRAA